MARPSMDEMRKNVMDMYPGPNWKTKVRKMPEGQVFAIFQRERKKREEAEMDARAAKRRAARGQVQPANDDIPF